jgi:hypothetical protein
LSGGLPVPTSKTLVQPAEINPLPPSLLLKKAFPPPKLLVAQMTERKRRFDVAPEDEPSTKSSAIAVDAAAAVAALRNPTVAAAAAAAAAIASNARGAATGDAAAVIVRSVEINDSKNRFVLTRGQTQADIGKEFGVAVCTKGRFYDGGAYPAPGQEPRLSLEISGKDAAKVAACERKIIELVTALNPLALLGIASAPQGDYQRAQMTSLVRISLISNRFPL